MNIKQLAAYTSEIVIKPIRNLSTNFSIFIRYKNLSENSNNRRYNSKRSSSIYDQMGINPERYDKKKIGAMIT